MRKAILLITATASLASWLIACHKSGTRTSAPFRKWTLNIGRGRHPLALGSDGTIYALLDSNVLVAIDNEGHRKWTQQAALEGKYSIGPAIGADGTIYVVGHNRIGAYNPDGSTHLDLPIGTSAASFGIALAGDRL